MSRLPLTRHRSRIFSIAFALAIAFAIASGCSAAMDQAAGCASACGPETLDQPIVDELESGIEKGSDSFDHSSFDVLLAEHVNESEGTVDYEALADDADRLDTYLRSLAEADLASLSRDAQLALLINAYNAYTLRLILDHYPDIESIKDVDAPWSSAEYEVGGHTLSLDQIEHGLIRPLYRDPRIHFAVNCAAVDCPPLADSAYTGDAIDEQLDARTEATLSDEQFVRVEGGELRYSRVMLWYRHDFVDDSFEGSADDIASYIKPYTRESVRDFVAEHDADPPASPLDYDWSLNDAN